MSDLGPAEPWTITETGLPDKLRPATPGPDAAGGGPTGGGPTGGGPTGGGPTGGGPDANGPDANGPDAGGPSEGSTSVLRQAESVFALANGHIGLRGNLDEGSPCGMPGTYLNSLLEERDLPYPEAGYGFPERTQTIVDAPNGKLISLTVDDERFDILAGTVRHHRRRLDLRAGTLSRDVEWVSPAGAAVRIRSVRVVSFPLPSVAAIRYEVEALDRPVRIRIDSDLLANEEQPDQRDDPRASAVLDAPLEPLSHTPDALLHRTRRSGIEVASAVAHVGPPFTTSSEPDRIRALVSTTLEPGVPLRLDKFLAYAWGVAEPVDNALAARDEAVRLGFDGLLERQREYLDDFWATADVELDGDPEVQQGVRFGLFHVLQAGAQAGPHPIAAKGLTGNGYDGHVLWDTETFVLPVLTYTHPACVGPALRWRHATLDAARRRARELRLAGAAYPWRTIGGPECSGYWPAGTAALHVNADIAVAVLRYVAATGDEDFLREAGLEILVETARLWNWITHADDEGVVHIDGVTGPDEYTALVDDNLFTNLMAQSNLLGAADAAERLGAPGVTADEIGAWRSAARRLFIPYAAKRDVHEQHSGFTRLEEWDFATGDEDYPLMLHYPYLDLYRRQVVKQADVVLAMMLRGDAFSAEEKRRNFAYYEARTVRDSSLSAPAQAVLAAETDHLELAYDYAAEAALLDLRSGGEASGDGLHIAACAGAWIALVQGFGGLRDHDGHLSFAPRLPERLPRLRFSLRWRESRLRVTVEHTRVTYAVSGADLTFHHHGSPLTVAAGETRVMPPAPAENRPAPPSPRPPQRRT
ncbi:glycoside hydrolase family 65 protein [Pseudosporangium ferrugineum]|uniref:Alpha,alpha-trehalose phosphorylase n=1 Tax=Pseudosporangium ferrugineum TaxID=439699 RepID=A0A2T0RU38_9ACTN|nr:glycosyl hydrolase family 65 protein [Pseudosporangium ferrugineum]PRY24709.1 alpha,alpha-trehalose phosphorylase [Pseudosporangium ferrugineum]